MTAPDGAFSGKLKLGQRRLPWRLLLAAALMSLALGAALYEDSNGGRSVAPPALRPHGFSQEGLLSIPLAARGPVSAALGGDSPAYRVSADRGALRAASPAQHLSTTFTSSGASVTSGATRVALSLRGVGYGSSLSSVAAVAPDPHENHVLYAHPGLSEWYANGPLGLEQGFTIARSPAGHAAGPLTLAIALSGNAQAALARGGKSVRLSRAGKTVLSYSGLSATDARGRALRSWLALEGTRLLLRVDARGARYPVRIDPFVQQARLTGTGASGTFGWSVALSSDGNTALIGAPRDNGNVGAVWVFTRAGSTWTEQEELTGPGEVGAGEFGEGIALSSDGNTALIGGPGDSNGAGTVWVFTRPGLGSPYTEKEKFPGGPGELGSCHDFGGVLALSSDGNTALVGGPCNNDREGAVWVWARPDSGSPYTEHQELTGSDELGLHKSLFGASVALSSDGNTALIGGPEDCGGCHGPGVGAAWAFTRPGFGSSYTEQKKLTSSGQVGEAGLGWSVALSSDGNTALIGGPFDSSEEGAAWVFTRAGSTWTEQEKLKANGEVGGAALGEGVALSSDGNTALIGGPADSSDVGATWVFTRPSFGSPYGKQEKLTGSGEAGNCHLGWKVALSSEGGTALIGNENGGACTATFVFVNESPTVDTGPASEVAATSAKLNGTVNPDGETVSKCKFEYGTTTSYGSEVQCSSFPGMGTSPVAVSVSLPDLTLSAGTTYHYRLIAAWVGCSQRRQRPDVHNVGYERVGHIDGYRRPALRDGNRR